MKRAFDIAKLIEKGLRGELSGAEKERLAVWRRGAPENEEAFQRMKAEGFYERGMERWRSFDASVAFGRFLERRQQRLRIHRIWRRGLRVAAVMVPLVVAVAFYLGMSREEVPGHGVEMAQIVPGSSKAKLTLGDGRTIEFGATRADSLIETDGTQIAASQSSVVYAKAASDALVYNRLEIPRGGEFCLELSDGTRVWLNSSTEIEYPVAFGGGERRVRLRGEAYFEVTRDTARPFRVEFGGTEVTVLGTSFNVQAYPDETASYTTLAEGSVRVATEEGVMRLRPGEQAKVDASSGEMEKRQVDAANYTSWMKGRFVFVRQPLENIMRTLARWYNIRVIFREERAKHVSLSGNVRRYEQFSTVTDMLEMMGDVKFEVIGKDVYISTIK